jgi:hypothetical protein
MAFYMLDMIRTPFWIARSHKRWTPQQNRDEEVLSVFCEDDWNRDRSRR